MKRYTKYSLLIYCLLLVGFFILNGCRKKPAEQKPPESTARKELTQQEKAILNDPEAVVCELKEAKIDSLNLETSNLPYFARRPQRENKNVYHGKLTIEQTDFFVILPADNNREFALINSQTKKRAMWWGADELGSRHKINGKFYEFAVIGNKQKFVARPYRGDLGIFRAGAGDRDIQTAEFKGSLDSKDSAVAVGPLKDERTEPAKECLIPVGDYRPNLLYMTYDNLQICLSNNYHSDLQGKDRGEREKVYGITVRKDEPFVFDFSNKPAIVFDQPKKDQNRFQVGSEIKFAAVLIDPNMDMMIRGLDDTAVMVKKEYKDSEGNISSVTEVKSLDPNVVITRADGEVVAEGVMPFG